MRRSALFIGGVVQSFQQTVLRVSLLEVAVVALVWDLTRILVLPALRPAL